jgi:hypothetical protein
LISHTPKPVLPTPTRISDPCAKIFLKKQENTFILANQYKYLRIFPQAYFLSFIQRFLNKPRDVYCLGSFSKRVLNKRPNFRQADAKLTIYFKRCCGIAACEKRR